MDELFLMSGQENMPIAQYLIRKYNLKKGRKSPFTNMLIVDRTGDATPEEEEKVQLQPSQESQMFTTAEIIDIAEGVDSEIMED